MEIEITERILGYHPDYEDKNVPYLRIGNKRLMEKYGWKAGDIVEVREGPEGILIKKP